MTKFDRVFIKTETYSYIKFRKIVHNSFRQNGKTKNIVLMNYLIQLTFLDFYKMFLTALTDMVRIRVLDTLI